MKKIIFSLLLILIFTTCAHNDARIIKSNDDSCPIETSIEEIVFDAKGGLIEFAITKYPGESYHVESSDNWFSIYPLPDEEQLKYRIVAKQNNLEGEEREGGISIRSGQQECVIPVKQLGDAQVQDQSTINYKQLLRHFLRAL